MNPFEYLGLTDEATPREVKRAYAVRLKQCRPDEDAKGFQQLHEAYAAALAHAQWRAEREAQAPERPNFDAVNRAPTVPIQLLVRGPELIDPGPPSDVQPAEVAPADLSPVNPFAPPLRVPSRPLEALRWTLPADWSTPSVAQPHTLPNTEGDAEEDPEEWIEAIVSMARTPGIDAEQLRDWLDRQPALESLSLKDHVGAGLFDALEESNLPSEAVVLLADWFGFDVNVLRHASGHPIEQALLRSEGLRWLDHELQTPIKRWMWIGADAQVRATNLRRRMLRTVAAPANWWQRTLLWIRAPTLSPLLREIEAQSPGALKERASPGSLEFVRMATDDANPFPWRFELSALAALLSFGLAWNVAWLLEQFNNDTVLFPLLLLPFLWVCVLQETKTLFQFGAILIAIITLGRSNSAYLVALLIALEFGALQIRSYYATRPSWRAALGAGVTPIVIALLAYSAPSLLVWVILAVLGLTAASGARFWSFVLGFGALTMAALAGHDGEEFGVGPWMIWIATFPAWLMAADYWAARGDPADWPFSRENDGTAWKVSVVMFLSLLLVAGWTENARDRQRAVERSVPTDHA